MMSVTAGARSTKIQMLLYTITLMPITLAPTVLGYANYLYGAIAFILSGFFVYTAVKVLSSNDLKHAKLMFGYSVFYLFALFAALMIS